MLWMSFPDGESKGFGSVMGIVTQWYRSAIVMMVKTAISLLVVLLVAILFLGGNGAADHSVLGDTFPPRSFASVDEMKRWGESSAFGGGMVSEPYLLGGYTVYVVNRMHTSGVLSSELSFYTLNDDGKGLSLALFQPPRYSGFSTKMVEDAIVCESQDPETGKTKTILTVTRHFFDTRPFPPR